jgi:hypothetical protein
MWLRVRLLKTDVVEEFVASIFRIRRIRELGTLAVTGGLLINPKIPSSLIRSTLMTEVIHPPKHRLYQDPWGVTSQKI